MHSMYEKRIKNIESKIFANIGNHMRQEEQRSPIRTQKSFYDHDSKAPPRSINEPLSTPTKRSHLGYENPFRQPNIRNLCKGVQVVKLEQPKEKGVTTLVIKDETGQAKVQELL